jgi:hypothetical protein
VGADRLVSATLATDSAAQPSRALAERLTVLAPTSIFGSSSFAKDAQFAFVARPKTLGHGRDFQRFSAFS